jgi:hypothetical protein
MYYEATKQEYFHHFDQWIGGHKLNSLHVGCTIIVSQEQQVYDEVQDKESDKEQACQRHNNFLGDGGIEESFSAHNSDD